MPHVLEVTARLIVNGVEPINPLEGEGKNYTIYAAGDDAVRLLQLLMTVAS